MENYENMMKKVIEQANNGVTFYELAGGKNVAGKILTQKMLWNFIRPYGRTLTKLEEKYYNATEKYMNDYNDFVKQFNFVKDWFGEDKYKYSSDWFIDYANGMRIINWNK